ncbi:MAG: hypothetical protein E7515_06125 [Ruminococcaceae bacterium]|nr:hypothetical protein [Oscillospiraceae bacterium]
MKPWAKILLIALALTVIALILFAVWKHVQNSVVDKYGMVFNANITSVYYISGGGMDGNFTEIQAKADENGKVSFKRKKDGLPPESKSETEYEADRRIFTDIVEKVSITDLYSASKKPDSNYTLLDAPSSTLIIRFEDGDEIRITSEQDLSEEETEACRKVVEILENEEYKINA